MESLGADPTYIVVVGSYANGSAFATYWDDTDWINASAPLMQGKIYTNFSSLSAFQAENLKVFGLTNESEIHSYILDRHNPLSWTYDMAIVKG